METPATGQGNRSAPLGTTWRTMTRLVPAVWDPWGVRISYSHGTMTNDERMQRESSLIATIRKQLPEFAKACADDTESALLHQDAFAADCQEDEYTLLGMAIKYAGLSYRTRRRRNSFNHAKVRSTTERHRPSPLPCFVLRMANRGKIWRVRQARRMYSAS